VKTHLALAAVALLAGVPAAGAQSATPAKIPSAAETKVDTETFSRTVPSANQFEIESSRLAEQKNVAADVKDFASLMIKDHTKAGEDFKAALERSQTTASVTPSRPALQPKDQTMLDQLKSLDGEAFQTKYIVLQTEAHKQALALFSTYAQSGDDPALKVFANKTLPTLRMHEKHLKDVAAAH
jgi:putative membrane protein